jgi:large subunit ribosomal protein L19
MHLIDRIEKQLGKPELPVVHVGDEVAVSYLIREGEKERVQKFIGQVISLKGRGIRRTVTVRRIVQGEGVERIFPLHGPRVQSIDITRHGDVRRAKLYFLRDRTGKKARVKELLGAKARARSIAEAEASSASSTEVDSEGTDEQ